MHPFTASNRGSCTRLSLNVQELAGRISTLYQIQEEVRLPSIFWTCHSSHDRAGLDCSVHILYLTSLTLAIDPCSEPRQRNEQWTRVCNPSPLCRKMSNILNIVVNRIFHHCLVTCIRAHCLVMKSNSTDFSQIAHSPVPSCQWKCKSILLLQWFTAEIKHIIVLYPAIATPSTLSNDRRVRRETNYLDHVISQIQPAICLW